MYPLRTRFCATERDTCTQTGGQGRRGGHHRHSQLPGKSVLFHMTKTRGQCTRSREQWARTPLSSATPRKRNNLVCSLRRSLCFNWYLQKQQRQLEMRELNTNINYNINNPLNIILLEWSSFFIHPIIVFFLISQDKLSTIPVFFVVPPTAQHLSP